MICDTEFLCHICEHFGVTLKWLFGHFPQILNYEEMWEEAVPDFHEKYFEMPTVHKLLFCREILFDFEEDFPDERELTCLNTIFNRVEDILDLRM